MNNQRQPSNPKNFSILWLMLTAVLSTTLVLLVLFSGLLPVHLSFDAQQLAGGQPKNTGTATTSTDANQAKSNNPVVATTQPSANPAPPPDVISPIPSDILKPDQQNTVTLIIPPKQNLSYHIAMERDYALKYTWHTDGKPLYSEFRGERTDGKATLFKNFSKITSNKASGLFIVPFIGNFSWYWDNKTDKPITVLLSMKGAYTILGQQNAAQ
jgi:hypothetical protein